MLALLAAITVIDYGCILEGSTPFHALILSYPRDLIAGVVGVDSGRIDTPALPVQDFSFNSPAQHVGIDLLLPALRCAAVYRSFISKRHYLTASAATSGVGRSFRSAILIGTD